FFTSSSGNTIYSDSSGGLGFFYKRQDTTTGQTSARENIFFNMPGGGFVFGLWLMWRGGAALTRPK
ncbi:hypothetical protein, partial [Enterobacter intestinihominis]